MNISAPFIVRPIATALLVVAVVLVGLLGYRALSVAALPTVDFPSIQVVTSYPGASPDVVQSSISAPLEYHLSRIPGLVVMTSSSSYGINQITLQFSLSRNIAAASLDAGSHLPAQLLDIEMRPIARQRFGQVERSGGDLAERLHG